MRVGRALTGFVAVATTAAVDRGRRRAPPGTSSDAVAPAHVQVAAPSFVLGDIDAVVLSSTFDEDGARAAMPPSVQSAVAQVPGVQSVSGVIDTFAPVVTRRSGASHRTPRCLRARPILFSYHQDDQFHVVAGRARRPPRRDRRRRRLRDAQSPPTSATRSRSRCRTSRSTARSSGRSTFPVSISRASPRGDVGRRTSRPISSSTAST